MFLPPMPTIYGHLFSIVARQVISTMRGTVFLLATPAIRRKAIKIGVDG